MSLGEQLAVRTPLIWVQSDEPRRVIGEVTDEIRDRPILRLDVMDGLVSYDTETETWKKVLIDGEEGQAAPTDDLFVSLHHALKERGVMIIENAHLIAEKLVGLLGYVSTTYVDAFFADDADKVPAMFVLISCKSDVPPEILRSAVAVNKGLPDADELEATLRHIYDRLEIDQPDEVIAPVRAGLGLSEFEFAQACSRSLKRDKELDPEYINAIKIDNLKRGGVLEIRRPSITLEGIGGLDNAKTLMRRVAWTWYNPDEAAQAGIGEPLRRVLLVGVPGSGKSAICEAAADALGLDLAKFGVGRMMNKYVGESEANMRRAFAQVAAMRPLTLWVDEFGRDMSGGASSAEVDGGTTDRVHGEFLQGIQELPPDVFLVAAANRIDNLPPEMLRADRFDKVMFVGFPTEAERIDIFRIHLGDAAANYDLPALAKATTQFTGAEIKALIREVRFTVVGDTGKAPSTSDIVAFAPKMKGRVWVNHRERIVEMYTRAKSDWDWASSQQEAEADFVLQALSGSAKAPRSAQAQNAAGNAFSDALRSSGK